MSKLTVLMLLIAALLATNAASGVASARPASKGQQPHTPVSSDGSIPAANNAGVQRARGELYVESAQGSGAMVNGGTETERTVATSPVPSDFVGITTIIGTDNRVQVTSTTTYPYRAIAQISFTQGGSTYGCTGWLINANTVATAGHCVYDNGAWSSNVRVYPGRNGSSTPYGSCSALRLHSVTGWTQNRNPVYDYGAIKLNCSVGNTTGWFGYRWQSASLTGQATQLFGYPCDKPYPTLWGMSDSVRQSDVRQLHYANDTFGCQSGSPVWNSTATCTTCGIAIHAYGVYGGSSYNRGTRITEGAFNNLTNWRNAN
jgi:glutamyl endopeptidase